MENFQIKQVQIRNLWQQGDIQWDLWSDVNVLIGNNGSGKTTIINLIYEAMKTNEIDIDFEKFNWIDNMMIQLNEDHRIEINADGRKLIGFESLSGFQTEKINTFDSILSSVKPNKTLLDAHIEKLKEPFVRYQRNLSRKIEQLFYKQNTVTKAEREQIFAKKDLFIKYINDLFKDTHKTFNEDDFVFAKSGQTSMIEPYNLSSGEKQVFLILLTILLQDEKPCILLLDEPEISLHIEWQRVLIKMIRDLNENCQVIIVTHSPTLYFKGWSDKMKRISDIVVVHLPVATPTEIDLKKINDFKNKLLSMIQVKSDKYRFTRAAALIIDYKPKLSFVEVMHLLEIFPQEYIKQPLIITAIINHINDFSDFKRFLDKIKALQVKIRDANFFTMMTKIPTVALGIELINNIQDFDLQPNELIFQVLLRKAHHQKEIDLVESTRKYYNIPLSGDYGNQLKLRMRT